MMPDKRRRRKLERAPMGRNEVVTLATGLCYVMVILNSPLIGASNLFRPITNGYFTNQIKSGCNISYFDENLQPIAQTNINQTLSNGQAAMQAAYPASTVGGSGQANGFSSNGIGLGSAGMGLNFIGLECQHITAEQLHEQFNRMRSSNSKVVSLVVRDSYLNSLGNLPQGAHELRKMVISNTSIDLEVLKEGSESLNQLTTLVIANERISNIPQNFFQEMQSLKELRLENDQIAYLDGDAFHNLDDSLELLDLSRNRFNRFPMAVKNLAQLAVLDLSDNDIIIDTQDNDLPDKLEPLLNLRDLAMNRINCTCEFSSSPFYEWIVRTHISGVRCFAPDKLKFKEVIVFERDEFCTRSSSATLSTPEIHIPLMLISQICCFLFLYFATYR